MYKHLRALIVDDFADNRFLLSQFIELLGAKHDSANNGKEGIEMHTKYNYDIIFMDIEMPVMNGFETTLHIRNSFSFPKNKVPIIAITAHAGYDFETKIRSAGFDDYITKPYSMQKLEQVIKKHLM